MSPNEKHTQDPLTRSSDTGFVGCQTNTPVVGTLDESEFNSSLSQTEGQRRNFWTLAIQQIVVRTGWIFKTESIVMPFVMDAIGCGTWVRACLPMLNRFGQSVPPLLASSLVASSRYKKWILVSSSATMGLMFLLFATIWLFFLQNQHGDTEVGGNWILAIVFLAIYAIFFSSVGINQIAMGTLTGKLVSVQQRGKLMWVATLVGSTLAITSAWFFMRPWLAAETRNFFMMFLVAGSAFVLSAFIASQLLESADTKTEKRFTFSEILRDSIVVLRSHREFRLLAIIAGLFGMSITLFPHYQALAIQRLGMGSDSLLFWLIAQNMGVAVFGIPAGKLADWFGNRLVLQIALLCVSMGPVLAMILTSSWVNPSVGRSFFVCVFVIVGLTPVLMRVFSNFVLEFAIKKDQPKYLGVLSLCMAGPAIFSSTALGIMLDRFGFELVFGLVIGCLACGWALSFFLVEPRHEIGK